MSGPPRGVAGLFERMPGGRDEAMRWAATHGDDLGRAWTECPRGDWLLWMAGILEVPAQRVALSARDCAEFSLSLLPLAEHEAVLRPQLDLIERWAAGEVEAEACARAAKDVLKIYEDPTPPGPPKAPTAGYATAAVSAAVSVPVYRSPLGLACGAAAAALKAAQVATPNDEEAIADAHRKCADLVRARVPFSLVAEGPAFRRYVAAAARPPGGGGRRA